jgi:uncharacterized protein YkwD
MNKIIIKILNFFKKLYDLLTGKKTKDIIVPISKIEYKLYNYDQFDIDVNNAINKIRKDLGLTELQIVQDVSDIAYSHCEYLKLNSNDKVVINHDNFLIRTEQVQLRYPNTSVNENVAGGYSTASSFVNAWKNSPGHYANISNIKWTHTGIAHIIGNNNKLYVVQLFFRK